MINPLDGAFVFVDLRYYCTDILIIWPNHLVLRVVLEWTLLMVFLFPNALCTFERISAFRPFGPLLFLLNEPSLHLMVQGLCMCNFCGCVVHPWWIMLETPFAWIGKQYLNFLFLITIRRIYQVTCNIREDYTDTASVLPMFQHSNNVHTFNKVCNQNKMLWSVVNLHAI